MATREENTMDPSNQYNDCLMSMKYTKREMMKQAAIKSTRENRTQEATLESLGSSSTDKTFEQATRASIGPSMVPDVVVLQHSNYTTRRYEIALMFVDVSGFTDLCERYTKAFKGGPSRLTQTLNAYIGALVQEVLLHSGDVLNFSGDALLAMWKKTAREEMQTVVHSAIDCGLSIQKNYGTYNTDVGVVLKVKVAISAGDAHFALIGDSDHSHYLIVGQAVWDVKTAEAMSSSGDVITTVSLWSYGNQAEYITETLGEGDKKHVKVLNAGISWKKKANSFRIDDDLSTQIAAFLDQSDEHESYYREFSLRPVMLSALRSSWQNLRKFMVKPVVWAVENDEPIEYLTEVRRVIILFLNIVVKPVTDEKLIQIVDNAFKCVYSISSAAHGLLNKLSMFDKDLMFLLVFGLRGMAHENEAEKSLLCAQEIQESLTDPQIISVSAGVTTGTTYCGVVGHVLRREYTVIGPAVNKAARLMMAYPKKVTCDKETFLKSKMEQQLFRLMEFKPMKGIKRPGPVYEFNKHGWSQTVSGQRLPILGRNEELQTYILALQQAINNASSPTDKSAEHANEIHGIVFLGDNFSGKTRLLEECLHLTPDCIPIAKIPNLEKEQGPYGLFRQIAQQILVEPSEHYYIENVIRDHIYKMNSEQIYAANEVFGCQFPLDEQFHFSAHIIGLMSTQQLLLSLFKNDVSSLWVVAINGERCIDDKSWPLLLFLMKIRSIFVIINIQVDVILSDVARGCTANNALLKVPLKGLDDRYHAALACQFLDVHAIPVDLEKLIQSASHGVPGWIQNCLISLVQQGNLNIITTTREKAISDGAVVPPTSLLYAVPTEWSRWTTLNEYFEQVLDYLNVARTAKRGASMTQGTDFIQVAVLPESYDVLSINMSIDDDVSILKTYDSLSPFEKMLLKCSSVLGIVFSRRMMKYILQCHSPRRVAEAVAKLFSIGVLECEGGDFTRNTSMVLIHPSPDFHGVTPPYCSCLGIERLKDCDDLPMYAFCGYMRFRRPLFRTVTYELLTETQKHEMHTRALFYLEYYTRRCQHCGSDIFHKMMGKRTNDGLIKKSKELKEIHERMRELAAEAKYANQQNQRKSIEDNQLMLDSATTLLPQSLPMITNSGQLQHDMLGNIKKRGLHSFSSTDVAHCECMAIVKSVYGQIIDHCRGAGEHEKLFEAYLEYAELSVINLNIPQALHLMLEAEEFFQSSTFCEGQLNAKNCWLKDFFMGRIWSLRGSCMIECGELKEAKRQLYGAMELYREPFPTSKFKQTSYQMQTFLSHWYILKVAPRTYIGKETGLVGIFYEEVAVTLNRLYKLFVMWKEHSKAELAARWSLNYALKTNANFELLCESYGNMISVHKQKHEYSKCVELEKLAKELCSRKRGLLNVGEMRAISILYTSVCLFYAACGKKNQGLEFGLPTMRLVTNLATRERVVIWVLNLLLSDLHITEMVELLKETLYPDDQFNMSSAVWYYVYAMVLLIDTGYSLETYQTCERFYMQNGDTIFKCKAKDAAYDYFACMWLLSVRVEAWERFSKWEIKIKEILYKEKKNFEHKLYLQLIILEGFLILLSREIDGISMKRVSSIKKIIADVCRTVRKYCSKSKSPVYYPRYLLLLAYYNCMQGHTFQAKFHLQKAIKLADEFGEKIIHIWAEHTRQHWAGTLDPALVNYWSKHTEPGHLLDCQRFSEFKLIIPYTLPLPKKLGIPAIL